MTTTTPATPDQVRETKQRLVQAFRAMRHAGLVARKNFLCCQTCGAHAATMIARRALDRGWTIRGYAFYHQQDNADRRAGRDFYIGFGQPIAADGTPVGLEPALIGRLVCDRLAEAGVAHEWDGDPRVRIRVVQEREQADQQAQADQEAAMRGGTRVDDDAADEAEGRSCTATPVAAAANVAAE